MELSRCRSWILEHTSSNNCGAWALVAAQQVESPQTRDWTHAHLTGRWISIHFTTREVHPFTLYSSSMSSGFVIHSILLLPLQVYTHWNSCSEVRLGIAQIHSLCHELLSSISDGEDVSGLLATLVALAKGRLWDREISLPNSGPELMSTLRFLCLDGQLPGHLFCIQTQNPAGCSFRSTYHFVFLFYFWITEALFWLSSLSLLLFSIFMFCLVGKCVEQRVCYKV